MFVVLAVGTLTIFLVMQMVGDALAMLADFLHARQHEEDVDVALAVSPKEHVRPVSNVSSEAATKLFADLNVTPRP